MMIEKRRLGDILLEKGLINKIQVEGALSRQKQWGGRFGENLVKLGYVNESSLLKSLSTQLNFPCADLSKVEIRPEACNLIPGDLAKKHKVIPFLTKKTKGRDTVFVAMADPTNIAVSDEIRFTSGYMPTPVIATTSQIENAIEKFYLKHNIKIQPLVKKAAPLKVEQMQTIHEVPLPEKLKVEKKKKIEVKDKELLALISFLDEKGIIKKDECIKALKRSLK